MARARAIHERPDHAKAHRSSFNSIIFATGNRLLYIFAMASRLADVSIAADAPNGCFRRVGLAAI
jgi:hypothetical protein